MTEIGRTSALNALLGQILNPRGGSFAGTDMEMDAHGWMDVVPKQKRPTDYLGNDTGAAMDILRAVADERIAMAAPPDPAPMAAGPGMARGGMVRRRGYAVGGLVSPLPAQSGAMQSARQPGAGGAFAAPSTNGALAGPAPMPTLLPSTNTAGGALDATNPMVPPLEMPTTTGQFSGAFNAPAAPALGRVGGAPTVAGGAFAAPGAVNGAVAQPALAGAPQAPGGALGPQRFTKTAGSVSGALMADGGLSMFKGPGWLLAEKGLADGGAAEDEPDQDGDDDMDAYKGIGSMLMQTGMGLMNGKANGGVVDAAVAATSGQMAGGALGAGGPWPAGTHVGTTPLAPDELPIEGGGLEATPARLGILGAGYQGSSGPGVMSGAMKPGLSFTGGKAGGGLVHGPGDGRSDSIPVDMAGSPGAIADNEYVVPAYAVSALGNGSSEAGARKLDAMVINLKEEWPKKIKSFGKPKAGGKPMKAKGGAFADGGAKTPGYVQRSQKNIFSRLEKLQDERPYEQDVAALNADQLQAFKQARGVATGDSTGYFKAVQGGQDLLSGVFDGDGSNKAYDDELVQASLADFDRGERIASADADRKAAARGAFGSRRGITEGAAAETAMKNRALLGSQLREQGLERRTAAAGQIAKLAGDERNAAIGNVALLTGVGNQVQEYNQSLKDAGMNRLKTQSAIVAGTPYSGGAAGANRMQGALGGAMAGAGAGAMTGNPYAIAGGAVIGGAAGYFGSKDGGAARRRGGRAKRQRRGGAFADGGSAEKPSGSYREKTLAGRRSKNVVDQRNPALSEADRASLDLFKSGVEATVGEVEPAFIDHVIEKQRSINLGPITDLTGRVALQPDGMTVDKIKALKAAAKEYPGGEAAFWKDQERQFNLHDDAVRETQNLPPLMKPEPMVKPGQTDSGRAPVRKGGAFFADGGAVEGAGKALEWYEPGYVGGKLGLPGFSEMYRRMTEGPSLNEAARPPEVPGDLPSMSEWWNGKDTGIGIPGPEERGAMRSPPMLDLPAPEGPGDPGITPPGETAVAGTGAFPPLPVSKPPMGPLVKKASTKRGKKVANDGYVSGGALGQPKQLVSAEPTLKETKVNPNDPDAWQKLKAAIDGVPDSSHDATAAVPTAEDKATMDYGPAWAMPLMVGGLALMAAKGNTLSESIGEAGIVGVNAFNQERGQRRQDQRLDIAEKRQASYDEAAGRKAQMDLEKTIYDMQQDALKNERDVEKMEIERQNAASLREYRDAQLGVSRTNAATAQSNAAANREYRQARLKQLDRRDAPDGQSKSDQHMVQQYQDAIVKAEAEGDAEMATTLRQKLAAFMAAAGVSDGGGDDLPPPPDGAELDDLEE